MPMRDTSRLLGAIAVAAVLLHAPGGLERAEAQAPTHTQTQPPTKQIKLTERQVEGFIAAQKRMVAARAEAELEAIAKEHGFAGLDEIDDVEANIVLLMSAIDPGTRAFSEPPILIKRRIDEVTADTSMPEAERKQVLQELTVALRSARSIQFPDNVELVKKYYDRLQTALE
jgi:hypothetical protein